MKCACAEGAWLSEPTVHLHSASYCVCLINLPKADPSVNESSTSTSAPNDPLTTPTTTFPLPSDSLNSYGGSMKPMTAAVMGKVMIMHDNSIVQEVP